MNMRPPEILDTPRLRLRPVTESDANHILEYAGAERPTLYMNFRRHRDIEESIAFARRCEDCWASGSAFPWAITRKGDDDRLIGVIELRLSPPKADFGYVLNEEYWGNGFASEAAIAVVGWALAQPGIFRVWATCHPENVASAQVLKKAGLQLEATLGNWEARPQLDELAGGSLSFARTRPPRS
jgi:RimJ/RimL family protein N-acetyltransferase